LYLNKQAAVEFFLSLFSYLSSYLDNCQSLEMPPKRIVPYRDGYKLETHFPKTGSPLLKPVHGAGPRCRVDYSPDDDGPWTMLQIMRIDEDPTIEYYTCAVPRYYAIPLILLNKRLESFEAQCAPDGTPLPLGDGSPGLRQRDFKDYTYLWRLRTRFLQAIFDMNHERQLDATWQCDRIHGYLHRTYKRYGHDIYQRHAYWRDERKAGRMPYSTPDIADMDWGAFLAEEMTTSTRLNAFLWNRVSQGYARVVQDRPPHARWQDWRRGGPSRDLSAALYRTPSPPSVSTPPPGEERSCVSEEPEEPVPATEQEEEEEVEVIEEEGGAAASSNSAARGNAAAAINCYATICDADNNVDRGGGQAANIDGSMEWALPFPVSDLSRGTRRILFTLEVPNDMAVTDLLCTVSSVADVSSVHQTSFRVKYASGFSSETQS